MSLICARSKLTIFFITGLAFAIPCVHSEPAEIMYEGQAQHELANIRSAAINLKKLTPQFFEDNWNTSLAKDCKNFLNQNKDVTVCNYTPGTQNSHIIKLQLLKITTVADITVSTATWEIENNRSCLNKENVQKVFSAKASRSRSPSADAALGGAQSEHEYASYEIPIRKDNRGETYFTISEFDKCVAQISLYKTEPL